MPPREYPQRGDWVRICEGGWVTKVDGASRQLIPVLLGADLVVQGIAFENDGQDPDYRTTRPSVWVYSRSLGMVYAHPETWAPIEGPPCRQAILGTP